MLEGCFKYYKGCQACQRFGKIQIVPASAMNSIIKPWLLRGWGMDMIGKINPPSSKVRDPPNPPAAVIHCRRRTFTQSAVGMASGHRGWAGLGWDGLMTRWRRLGPACGLRRTVRGEGGSGGTARGLRRHEGERGGRRVRGRASRGGVLRGGAREGGGSERGASASDLGGEQIGARDAVVARQTYEGGATKDHMRANHY
jgi:hypothetical protein